MSQNDPQTTVEERAGLESSQCFASASDKPEASQPDTPTSNRLRLMVKPPPRKRPSKSRSRSAPIRNSSNDHLSSLPMELILETAKLLHPKDLLVLCRVNVRLRDVLLARSARSCWRETLNNVPRLPDCPSDLTEPQYASFMFETFCMACGTWSRRTCQTFPSLRLRLCKLCRPGNLINGTQLRTLFNTNDIKFHEILPSSNAYYDTDASADDFYFKPEAESVIQEYLDADGFNSLETFVQARNITTTRMIAEGKVIAGFLGSKVSMRWMRMRGIGRCG
ncbi:hypothetical protein GALMADRAFT_272691 [Galerina marginata CBS 339.88]|uniref:F-box domain-containing protein n=1 Tax=Galerina marginata (strain CBS 339.88) TaxID=685588 RepID=A0A067SKC8_GALM3|nr:hypothetical protein GALMADRAFT_272691 [Galerina marginata CBS 339.88]